MTVEYVRTLYAYNRWANHRILDRLETVDRDKLTRNLRSSYPSIHDTVLHIVASEWVWMSRWEGISPSGFPDAEGLVDIGSIRSRWSDVESQVASFIDGLTAERLEADLAYRNTQGTAYSQPLGEQMCHVVNHSSYHRGQITTMLRQVEEVPVSTDMIVYLRN